MPGKSERRQWPRVPLNADVEFRRRREPHYTISMRDLTAQGCRIASPERLDKGELVWVQLPSLESLPAIVRWTAEWQSGTEFHRPMHPAVFEMMAERLAPTGD